VNFWPVGKRTGLVISRRTEDRLDIGVSHSLPDAVVVLLRDPVRPRPQDERSGREQQRGRPGNHPTQLPQPHGEPSRSQRKWPRGDRPVALTRPGGSRESRQSARCSVQKASKQSFKRGKKFSYCFPTAVQLRTFVDPAGRAQLLGPAYRAISLSVRPNGKR
jgi:hypothetical protein